MKEEKWKRGGGEWYIGQEEGLGRKEVSGVGVGFEEFALDTY